MLTKYRKIKMNNNNNHLSIYYNMYIRYLYESLEEKYYIILFELKLRYENII